MEGSTEGRTRRLRCPGSSLLIQVVFVLVAADLFSQLARTVASQQQYHNSFLFTPSTCGQSSPHQSQNGWPLRRPGRRRGLPQQLANLPPSQRSQQMLPQPRHHSTLLPHRQPLRNLRRRVPRLPPHNPQAQRRPLRQARQENTIR